MHLLTDSLSSSSNDKGQASKFDSLWPTLILET